MCLCRCQVSEHVRTIYKQNKHNSRATPTDSWTTYLLPQDFRVIVVW